MALWAGYRRGDLASRVGVDTVTEYKSWVSGCEDDGVKACVCACMYTHMDWCVTQGEEL